MNFFAHFGMEPRFQLDLNELRKEFYKKSRELHPDFNKSENEDFVYLTALNNMAYQTLLDPLSRLKYIIESSKGPLRDTAGLLSQDFLMDMMELHEKIHDAVMSKDNSEMGTYRQQIKNSEDEAFWETQPMIHSFDSGTRGDEILDDLSVYYYKLKYFKRLKQNLDSETSEL